ncbi:ATP-dependent Clp protease adapter ClpS [Intrasporangium calvum]|uniref:ATP-dependent Clp protease adapter protein ClpS n=1 Tax=Intrasporangium calvum (strain ATCC 23552 / DSM 43043 / JCM 3097 / NBRC 12989 / NCIMB 10167 / NRRL B-3866 / 7 KIP) TaxID=710696 RepID=E6S688_INTC7|nr:ATP-dependent Clp protease adapter ClpS [Intrasporangium calvum]ADU47839.1 ATP-dependent Clp protease adaptor protein ClpS [Intrasporangium calvum DSM 43043]AXG12949.1 ATP-dependent Clp protease adapter ClpS [Intrasporangium calvum]
MSTSLSLAPPAPVRSPETEEVTGTDDLVAPDVPWVTIVWNDPVNLMSYVTWVFETYFGYPRPKAEKLMMDVHTKGRAVVSHGPRESMERDAESLQGYGLWATFEKDE